MHIFISLSLRVRNRNSTWYKLPFIPGLALGKASQSLSFSVYWTKIFLFNTSTYFRQTVGNFFVLLLCLFESNKHSYAWQRLLLFFNNKKCATLVKTSKQDKKSCFLGFECNVKQEKENTQLHRVSEWYVATTDLKQVKAKNQTHYLEYHSFKHWPGQKVFKSLSKT